jgi:hypothetical protein
MNLKNKKIWNSITAFYEAFDTLANAKKDNIDTYFKKLGKYLKAKKNAIKSLENLKETKRKKLYYNNKTIKILKSLKREIISKNFTGEIENQRIKEFCKFIIKYAKKYLTDVNIDSFEQLLIIIDKLVPIIEKETSDLESNNFIENVQEFIESQDKIDQAGRKVLKLSKKNKIYFWILILWCIPIIIVYTVLKRYDYITANIIICILMFIILIFISFKSLILRYTLSFDRKLKRFTLMCNALYIVLSDFIICLIVASSLLNVNLKVPIEIIQNLVYTAIGLSIFIDIFSHITLIEDESIIIKLSSYLLFIATSIIGYYTSENKISIIIFKWALPVVTIALISLLIKIILIEKNKIKIEKNTFWFIALFIVTVAIQIVVIYIFFWNDDNNDLFLSIINVYACILGGVLTLGGVAWTIYYQQQLNLNDRIASVKPIFIKLNSHNSIGNDFVMEPEFKTDNIHKLYGIIQMTDNGIMFVDKITSLKHQYKPVNESTINKNSVIKWVISIPDDEKYEDLKLYVNDIYGTVYTYQLAIQKIDDNNDEIISYKEII